MSKRLVNEVEMTYRAEIIKLKERIKELDMLRAGARVSLIACRAAVQKGGEVTEEILTELIDELEVR